MKFYKEKNGNNVEIKFLTNGKVDLSRDDDLAYFQHKVRRGLSIKCDENCPITYCNKGLPDTTNKGSNQS